jgi:hypothetical protein
MKRKRKEILFRGHGTITPIWRGEKNDFHGVSRLEGDSNRRRERCTVGEADFDFRNVPGFG